MSRVFSLWIRLLTVAILALNLIGASSSSGSLRSQTEHPSPTLSEAQASIEDWLFAKPSSEIGQLSLQEVRRSKQVPVPGRALNLNPPYLSCLERRRDVAMQGLFSSHFLFPRKLFSSFSSDDPLFS